MFFTSLWPSLPLVPCPQEYSSPDSERNMENVRPQATSATRTPQSLGTSRGLGNTATKVHRRSGLECSAAGKFRHAGNTQENRNAGEARVLRSRSCGWLTQL